MPAGSGLDAQLGTKTEATVGTTLAPDHFWNFDVADITNQPSYIEGQGIRAGRKFKSVNQAAIARQTANGKIELPFMYKGMPWWMQHIMGSSQTPVVVPTGTLAFEGYYTPSGLRGKSFTAQIGTPDPNTGTVVPMNYNGCKVTDWDLTFADNANTLLTVTVDGWNVNATTPALGAATYITNNQLHNFSNVSLFTIGGTPTTTAGKTTVTAPTSVASVVTSLSIVGKNTLDVARYGLGNAGLKKEQLETDFTNITGTFTAEYNEAEFQSQFRVGTTTCIQIASLSSNFIEGSTAYQLSVICPTVKITKAAPTVSGVGITMIAGEFMVYDPDDGINPPIQIHIVSTDTAL